MEMNVSELLAAAREMEGADYIEGDRILCGKRYESQTAYMIEYLPLEGIDSMEKKARYRRSFLTESEYRHALEKEAEGRIQIIRRARRRGCALEYLPVPGLQSPGEG